MKPWGLSTMVVRCPLYRSGMVNSKSFVHKVLLRIRWKFELTVHFEHEIIGKHFTENSQKL